MEEPEETTWTVESPRAGARFPKRRHRWGLRAYALIYAPTYFALGYEIALGHQIGSAWPFGLSMVMILSGLALAFGLAVSWVRPTRPAALERYRDRLRLRVLRAYDRRYDEDREATLTELGSGWLSLAKGGAWLELNFDDGMRWEVWFSRIEEAQARLEALGVSAADRCVEVPLGRDATVGAKLAVTGAVAFLGVIVLAPHLPHMEDPVHEIAVFGATTLVLPLVWALRPARLRIGVDGLGLRGRLRLFIPYSDVLSVRARGRWLLIERHGATQTIGCGLARRAHVESIARRIQQAMAVAPTEPSARAVSALQRGDASWEEWCDRLGALFDEESDYRHAALQPDEVLSVLRDARCDPELRLGAALALCSSDLAPDTLNAALLRAARASVHPSLPAALERLAAGGELIEMS